MVFPGNLRHDSGMDKYEHAALLKRAIDESGLGRQAVADAVQRGVRTVGNWTSEASPTSPTEREKVILRKILGPYDAAGDRVERAVRQSDLIEWRQDAVLSFYKRQLYEQREETAS